jgi:septum formation topological specificity factor MinE
MAADDVGTSEWNRALLALAKECHKRRLELILMPTRKEQPDGPMQTSILETIVLFNQRVIPEDTMIPVALLDSKYQYCVLAIEISLDHTRICQVLKGAFEQDEKYARLSRAVKAKNVRTPRRNSRLVPRRQLQQV